MGIVHRFLTFGILYMKRILESWRIVNRANQKNKLYDEKIDNLKKIIPEAFQDGKLNVKELESLLSGYIAEDDFNYSFTWHGKQQAKRGAYLPTTLTLKPNKEKSKQFDETKNIYIEGDNLNVLKVLRDTYANKVKMIYIDPPYNTGNDFIYPDNFEQPLEEYKRMIGLIDDEGNKISTESETVGRKHTNWLNMMYSRLLLARDFLTDDGVIFISIDDNEQANLKKICDEIFGEDNFVADIIWEKVHTRKNSAKYFSESHDYILCISRDKNSFKRNLIPRENNDAYKNPDKDPKGPWKADPIYANNPYEADYQITKPNGIVLNRPKGRYWRYSIKTIEEAIKNNEIIWGNEDSFPMLKRYLSQVADGLVPTTLFTREFAGDNMLGSSQVKQLFHTEKVFNYPKPVKLLQRLLQIGTNKDSLIMDFFSGSATTAHAVLQQNFEDGGNRKFIMVQLPELINEKQEAYKEGYRTIAEIGQERIRRAGEKIISENPLLTTELDVGFKVFELTDTNFPQWNEEIDEENISTQMELLSASIHDEESAVYEVLLLLKEYLLDESVELVIPHIYVIGKNDKTLIYLHDQMSEETYQWLIKNYQEYSKVIIYDNALDQSQKINLQGTLKEKMETV